MDWLGWLSNDREWSLRVVIRTVRIFFSFFSFFGKKFTPVLCHKDGFFKDCNKPSNTSNITLNFAPPLPTKSVLFFQVLTEESEQAILCILKSPDVFINYY